MKIFRCAAMISGFLVMCGQSEAADEKKGAPNARIIGVIARAGVDTLGKVGNNPVEFSIAHIEAHGHLGPIIRFYTEDHLKGWVGSITIQDPRHQEEGSEEVVFVKRVQRGLQNSTVMVEKICCKKARITLVFPSKEKLLLWDKGIETGFNSLKTSRNYPYGVLGEYK